MSDLPTRLRAYRAHDATADALLDEAAAEIERLRAALGRIQDVTDRGMEVGTSDTATYIIAEIVELALRDAP